MTALESAAALAAAYQSLQAEIGKVIVGQRRVIDEILIALLSRGHCLVQGVPGLAKTLLVSTLAQALGMDFLRIIPRVGVYVSLLAWAVVSAGMVLRLLRRGGA